MTPDEYEHLVAEVLRGEGWNVTVTPSVCDFGLDVIGERDGVRLGVQAKMYLQANRPVNAATVMLTYGAAAYADCARCMVATDGRILEDALRVAEKLQVEIRVVPASASVVEAAEAPQPQGGAEYTFARIWSEHVAALTGRTLHRSNGRSNDILAVDAGGVSRRTSNGKTQRIDIDVFRWTIDRLLRGDTVLREDINAQSIGRVSSGVMLILGSLPMFEFTAMSIPVTENVRVHEDMLKIATQLPPKMAAQLAHKEAGWLRHYQGHLMSLPEAGGEVLAHLADGRQTKVAFELARTLFAVSPAEEPTGTRRRAVARMSEYSYGRIIERVWPALTQADTQRAFGFLCDRLADAVRMGFTEPDDDQDFTYIWRSAIEDHAQNLGHSLLDTLVNATFLSYHSSWTGPTSPFSSDELREMGPPDVVQALREWTPPVGPEDPSPEGLGRILELAVAADAADFAAVAVDFTGLDPTYVRGLLGGLADAAKDGKPFAWGPVVELCEWVVAQPRSASDSADGWDRDPHWGWARKQIASLFSRGFAEGAAEIPHTERERVWGLLAALAEDPDPTPEHEERYGGDNMDPATLSINTTRGEAMHAVVRYALWAERELTESRQFAGIHSLPEVQALLERHLDLEVDSALAIRSVYGTPALGARRTGRLRPDMPRSRRTTPQGGQRRGAVRRRHRPASCRGPRRFARAAGRHRLPR